MGDFLQVLAKDSLKLGLENTEDKAGEMGIGSLWWRYSRRLEVNLPVKQYNIVWTSKLDNCVYNLKSDSVVD